jgi:hypothetical protein
MLRVEQGTHAGKIERGAGVGIGHGPSPEEFGDKDAQYTNCTARQIGLSQSNQLYFSS